MKKIISTIICILLTPCMILGLTGCDDLHLFCKCRGSKADDVHAVADDAPKSSGKTQSLIENIEKNEVVTKTPDTVFAQAAADFSLELFKKELKTDKNTLVSPLSVLTALAITQNGADGKTLSQMEKALGGLSCEELNAYLGAYLNAVAGEGSELKAANSLWIADGRVSVENSFLQKSVNFFDAGIYSADFSKQKTVKDINSWVKDNTDGMIEKIIDKISNDNIMYIINALSFEAKWWTPYTDNCVRDGSFTSYNGKSRDVSYMYSSEYGYIKMNNAKGFLKSYEDDRFRFAALLPDEGVDIKDFVENLDGEAFLTAVNTAENCKVVTQMPKFKTEYSNELNDTLTDMGMKDAFNVHKADFSRLGTAQGGLPIYISKVIHKTYIEVAEKGTKAGAVTAVAVDAMSARMDPPPEVRLTRPFVYAIIDTQSGLPLFIGAQIDF